MSKIELDYEEAGKIVLRRATFAAFAAWFDAQARGRTSDAAQNLAIDCADTPGPEGLAVLFDDFGGLPEELAGEILEHVGTPGGGANEGYPMVRLREARAAHTRAGELRAQIAAHSPEAPAAGQAERDTRARLAAELAALEPSLLPLELLDAAERVSARAVFFRTPAGVLPFRPPPRLAVAAHVDAMSDFQANRGDASALGAGRTLMLASFIGDPQVLAASIEEYPALAQWIPGALRALASGGKVRTQP
jgi:hypothetical protein